MHEIRPKLSSEEPSSHHSQQNMKGIFKFYNL